MNEKIISKIDTDTYNKIGNTFAAVSFGSFLLGQALSHSYVDASLISYALSAFGYYEVISLYTNNNKEKTIDGKEVLKLYREFIRRYGKLNRELELDNPIEIFTLFNYLYNNGYLSKDKKFKYNLDAKTYNVGALLGANVIAGEGVCRHISGMLSDIMNENNIDSINLSVYLNNYFISYEPSYLVSNRQKELFDWAKANVLDKNFYGRTSGIIGQSIPQPVLIEKVDYNLLGKISGNHAITYVRDNDINYYLDPTSGNILRMNPIDNKLYSSSEVLKIKSPGAKLIVSDKTRYKELFDKSKEYTGGISLEEESELIKKAHLTIEDNQDIFEDFYNNNKELYSEITYKLLRLK